MFRTLRLCMMGATLLAFYPPLEAAVLTLFAPAYSACGDVSINGVVLPSSGDSIVQVSWNWGDGSSGTSFFLASHRYLKNGTYSVQATATSKAGESISQTVSVTITSAEDPACAFSVRVHPTVVALRDGQSSDTLRVEIRDPEGNLVPSTAKNISFVSSNPTLISVDSTGRISATGFGMAQVTVHVEGFPQIPVSDVYAGRFRVLPPVLYLSPSTHSKGRFELNAANADGTPLDLSKHQVWTQLNGPADVAKMDPDGTITALRAPQGLRENVSLIASIDGVNSSDNAALRINDPPFDPDLAYWPQSDIVYYAPKQAGHLDNASLLPLFQVPETTQAGFLIERLVTGVVPWQGDIQYLANIAGPGNPNPANETLPCGASGNAVGLGTDISKSHDSSCLWIDATPILPQWFVIFHELGHNVTLGARRFSAFAFASPVQNSTVTYVEGLASLVAMYLSARVQDLPSGASGISPERVKEITSLVRFGATNTLNGYVAKGAKYATIDATVLDDILAVLINDYGSSWVYRFYSVFLPQNEAAFPFTISTDAQQATFFVAAVSAATGIDLRPRFAGWGFPIDSAFWESIYTDVARLVSQRDPAAYAGRDRQMSLGETLVILDAEAFAVDSQPQLAWKVDAAPAGAKPALTGQNLLTPSFTPDRPGIYMLSLTARDALFISRPSTVAITVTTPPTINPGGIVNGASFAAGAPVSPGSIASVFGRALFSSGASGGVTLRMNGFPAFLFDVLPGQINFQVPWELAGQAQASVTVTVDGVPSSAVTVSLAPSSPGIFTIGQSKQGAILIASTGEVVAPIGSISGRVARPANRGEYITIYCTGLGPVENSPATGAKASSSPLSATTTIPTVSIGGVAAPATDAFFSGLAPGFVGLYQVNVMVPTNSPTGDSVPLVLSIGGSSSNSVTIAVQ